MIQEYRFSDEFQKAFKRLKKKYHSLPEDFNKLLLSLTDNPFQGDELNDGMRKVRLSISSKNKGKRGGGRVIVKLTLKEERLSFLYIYDKSEIPTISDQFLNDIITKIDQH